jgi:hypothetical protein
MADSGYRVTNGSEGTTVDAFTAKYRTMIDQSLARKNRAVVSAYYQRNGTAATVTAIVTNISGATLSSSDRPQVWAILYEDRKAEGAPNHTPHYVLGVASVLITPDLPDQATGTYQVQVNGVGGMNWSKSHIAVVVDALRAGSSAFDSWQATLATEGVPPSPTVVESPTATDTEVPTETPTPTDVTPTEVATTEVPTTVPTVPPPNPRIFLPLVARNYPEG